VKAIRVRRGFFPRLRSNLSKFYEDTRAEIRKVSWPTRDEVIRLSIVVIVLSVSMAIFLGVIVDGIFLWLYRLIGGI